MPEECAKEISLKICNSGSANIPLELAIDHQVIGNVVFFLSFLKILEIFFCAKLVVSVFEFKYAILVALESGYILLPTKEIIWRHSLLHVISERTVPFRT